MQNHEQHHGDGRDGRKHDYPAPAVHGRGPTAARCNKRNELRTRFGPRFRCVFISLNIV